jgi:hypothetical protein
VSRSRIIANRRSVSDRQLQAEHGPQLVDRADAGAGPVAVRFIHQQEEVVQVRQVIEVALADVLRQALDARRAAAADLAPIAYRWAENLRAYDAPEIRRFNRYYDSMAGESAVVVATDTATVPHAANAPLPEP